MSVDKQWIEDRILALVEAANKAKLPCEIVEITSDGTIRAGKWPGATAATAAINSEVEDFFENHMGKEARRRD